MITINVTINSIINITTITIAITITKHPMIAISMCVIIKELMSVRAFLLSHLGPSCERCRSSGGTTHYYYYYYDHYYYY